jgi:hypothetical protein
VSPEMMLENKTGVNTSNGIIIHDSLNEVLDNNIKSIFETRIGGDF